MNADGTGERSVHVMLRIQSQGAAQQFGVLSFAYASATETQHIVLVRVHKPDGTTVDTPTADAIDMPADVTREAPLYSDVKEKHLPVRSLSVGDTLEYQVDTSIDKPETPGQFWGEMHFTAPGSLVVLSEKLTLDLPAGKYVQVWSPNHKPKITQNGGRIVYFWDVPQLIPAPRNTAGTDAPPSHVPKDPDQDADGRNLPSVAWTTFHSWAEVGDWYRSLALQRAQSTDALRARALEIMKDAKTPEDQVRAIFDFVALRTRYVGIDFGVGRYQPHAAADVLAYQYGDCKDKDTLLEALLRSAGFITAPALIGVNMAPAPDVPTPAVFNHVITTVDLAGNRIWLDSTPQVGPFRYLIPVIRGEKALVVPATAPATLESTPVDPPYPFTEHFEASGTLDADGKFNASVTSSYRDDNELIVRAIARAAGSAEWDKVSQYVVSRTGFSGTTSNTQFRDIDDLGKPFAYTFDYARHPYGDWDNLRIVAPFPALEFSPLSSDIHEPDDDIQLGSPRTLVAVSHIRLPDGFQADLPDPVHVKSSFATFDLTYHLDANTITADRTVVVLTKKIDKADWKIYQQFTRDIGLTSTTWIQLYRKNAPKPDQSKEVTADNLMQTALEKIKAGDIDGALKQLDKVEKKNPHQMNLWALRGAISERYGSRAYTISCFHNELASYPDNANVVQELSRLQGEAGDAAGARQTVEQYLAHHPDDARIAILGANLQSRGGDNATALKTLQAAAAQNPDDRSLQIQISLLFIKLNRMKEAADTARAAINGTDDAMTLNDAAHQLAKIGLDLPDAEAGARKAIGNLEDKSAAISASQSTNNDFALADLLSMTWDTLGWTLFREGKPAEARPFILAAWLNDFNPEVADHLGNIDEALGDKQQAILDYSYSKVAAQAHSPGYDVTSTIEADYGRLHATGLAPRQNVDAEALQALRTFHLDRPDGAKGWGSFRIVLTAKGVVLDTHQSSGDRKLAAVQPVLLKMLFPDLVPPGSRARLLRTVVVSCSRGSTCDLVFIPSGDPQVANP